MKPIDAEKLKAKLDEHYRKYQSKYMETRTPYTQGLIDALDLAEQVIDSLQQEQPEVDLEKEYKEWWENKVSGNVNIQHTMEWYMHETARHFYELGKNSK